MSFRDCKKSGRNDTVNRLLLLADQCRRTYETESEELYTQVDLISAAYFMRRANTDDCPSKYRLNLITPVSQPQTVCGVESLLEVISNLSLKAFGA